MEKSTIKRERSAFGNLLFTKADLLEVLNAISFDIRISSHNLCDWKHISRTDSQKSEVGIIRNSRTWPLKCGSMGRRIQLEQTDETMLRSGSHA
ncbi:hypothetical protein JTB14_029852 [Gonioctena quinquepunctata]|nr:hypothetical protein JTB14_029852 [Gonioctena quinquepunctata]